MTENTPIAISPEMLRLAREGRGLRQTTLAERSGVPQASISKLENGLVPAAPDVLERLSRALGYPTSLFMESDRAYESTGTLFHRRRAGTPANPLRQLRAQVNLLRIHAKHLRELVELETDVEFHRMDAEQFGSPEGAASALRAFWRLPAGPITDVTHMVESAGGVVHVMRFPTAKVDAASLWPPDSAAPYFFMNDSPAGERMRFTLVHELAHMLLHPIPGEEGQEEEADRFAAAFLMPADDIIHDLHDLTLAKAFALKSYWQVSAQAIIRHAYNLGVITRTRYTSLFQQLSRLGYRRSEPQPIAQEAPQLLRRIADYCMEHLGYTVEDLARTCHLYVDEFAALFLDRREARPVLRAL